MGEDEYRISLFADDVMIYLRDPAITFTYLMETLETVGTLSGYRRNVEKENNTGHLLQFHSIRRNMGKIYTGLIIMYSICNKIFGNIRARRGAWWLSG